MPPPRLHNSIFNSQKQGSIIARNQSKAISGFFPIHNDVIDLIASYFRLPETREENGKIVNQVSVLDPCMGKGVALARLTEHMTSTDIAARVYGVELNTERYEEALSNVLGKPRIDEATGKYKGRPGVSRMLSGSYEFVESWGGQFSVVYLNPPFDDNGNEERRWFEAMKRFVVANGYMIMVAPQHTFDRRLGRMWDQAFTLEGIFAFPEEHRHFGELVAWGMKREEGKSSYDASGAIFDNAGVKPAGGSSYNEVKIAFPALIEMTGDDHIMRIPLAPGPKQFRMTVPNTEEAIQSLAAVSISASSTWRDLTQPIDSGFHQAPLVELGPGHVAAFIGDGAIKSLPLIDPVLGRILITGYSTKEQTEGISDISPDGTAMTVTQREQPVVFLATLNVDTGTVTRLSTKDKKSMEGFIMKHLDVFKESIENDFPPQFHPETDMVEFLPFVTYWQTPGVLTGATRVLVNGQPVRVMHKDAVARIYGVVNDEGVESLVSYDDVEHEYRNALPAQIVQATAVAKALQKQSSANIIGEPGVGKTTMSILALILFLKEKVHAAMQGVGKEKIVVIAPGHMIYKWKREIEMGFSELERTYQRKVNIVIPGKTPREKFAYRIDEHGKVWCSHCGAHQKALSLNKTEMQADVLVEDKIRARRGDHIECTSCHLNVYESWTNEIVDIDDAMNEQGISVIILSKEDAKLGAPWQHAVVPKVQSRHTLLDFKQDEIVSCPTCGGSIFLDEDGDYPVPAKVFLEKSRNAHCQCEVHQGATERTDTGRVIMQDVEITRRPSGKYLSTGRIAQAQRDDAGNVTGYAELTTKSYSIPKYIPAICGEPLFGFTRINDKSTTRQLVSVKLKSKNERTVKRYAYARTPQATGSARYELARYISRHYSKQYYLVVDEVHEYKGEVSIQGKAAGWLITHARKTISLTGTIYGGKASSLFFLLYRLSPNFRKHYEWNQCAEFTKQYGMREIITTYKSEADTGKTTKTGGHNMSDGSKRISEINGAMPGIITWLVGNSTFIGLDDLGIQLPDRSEKFHWIPMESELLGREEILKDIRRQAALEAAQGDQSRFSHWMHSALESSLAPDQDEIFIHPKVRSNVEKLRKEGKTKEADKAEANGTETWFSAIPFSEDRKYPKITQLLCEQIVADWNDHADLSVVYVAGTKRPAYKHVYRALKDMGMNPFVLTPKGDKATAWCDKDDLYSCDLEDRESAVKEAFATGKFNCMVTNPTLIATGLDLIQFNHAHYLGIPTYSGYKLIQSMGRLHRPGQQKNTTIHFWVYGNNPAHDSSTDNTVQALAMSILSAKMRAASIVTGDVGAALGNLSEEAGDIMTQLRGQILSGKQSKIVADNATFKSQMVINPAMRALEKVVEAFDNARVFGVEAPKITSIDMMRPAKIAAPVREIELSDIPLDHHDADVTADQYVAASAHFTEIAQVEVKPALPTLVSVSVPHAPLSHPFFAGRAVPDPFEIDGSPVAWAHLTNPSGTEHVYVTEYDATEYQREMGRNNPVDVMGYCVLNMDLQTAEFGWNSAAYLESVGLYRDVGWEPQTINEINAALRVVVDAIETYDAEPEVLPVEVPQIDEWETETTVEPIPFFFPSDPAIVWQTRKILVQPSDHRSIVWLAT